MLVFVQVVDEGSFSGAAKKLGISKASVSREISALEERLEAQLLRRTTRSMSLTEVGDLFYERCRRVVEEAENAERSVHQLQAEPSGLLRAAVPMSFGCQQVAPRIHRFLERHPGISVDIEATDRVVDLVHERIDLSLRVRRPRELSYTIRKLCPIRVLVCASPGYLARHEPPRRPTDLSDHDCLGSRGMRKIWHFANGDAIEPNARLTFDNDDALRRAALQDLGIAYLVTHVISDDIRSGRLVPLLLDYTHRGTSLYAAYPESRHLSPKVRAMIDWLAEELGPEPDWDRDLPVAGRAWIGPTKA